MKRKKRILIYLGVIILLVSCKGAQKSKDTGEYIYYVSLEGTALETENYNLKGKNTHQAIEDMLDKLSNMPKVIKSNCAIPTGVKVVGYQLENKELSLHFNENYYNMNATEEVLCRAAVVQTLVQIQDVDAVAFFVGENPIVDRQEKPIGLMRTEDFVQNTGSAINTYQVTALELCFANQDGERLVKEKVNVRYNSNMSMEKLIIEQLLKGPSTITGQKAIDENTKLLGVSLKDGICYVNFNEAFLTAVKGVKPEIVIYSVVNSVVNGGNATQVQILIDGESDVVFQGSVKLDKPLERNLDLMEETE
ncbi:MAG: GerMN domain-containing protein [Lachnospiraceae bacterium]